MDWEKLTSDVVAATTAAFGSLMTEKSDEHFYAFALYTDGDADTISPAANSIEQYEATLHKTREADRLQMAAYQWASAEWAYEAFRAELFAGIYRDLEKHRQTMPKSDTDFASYKKSVYQCMVSALSRMDESGFFAKMRENVVLFVTSSDDDEAFEMENASAKQLNPEPICARFLKRYETDSSVESRAYGGSADRE